MAFETSFRLITQYNGAVWDWAPTSTPIPCLFSAPRISRSTHEQIPEISLYFRAESSPCRRTLTLIWNPRTDPCISFIYTSWVSKPKRRRSPNLHTNTKTSFSTADIEKHPWTNPRYFVIISWVYKAERRQSPTRADEHEGLSRDTHEQTQVFRYTFLGLKHERRQSLQTITKTCFATADLQERPRTNPSISLYFPRFPTPKGDGAPPFTKACFGWRITRNTLEHTACISYTFLDLWWKKLCNHLTHLSTFWYQFSINSWCNSSLQRING